MGFDLAGLLPTPVDKPTSIASTSIKDNGDLIIKNYIAKKQEEKH